MRMYFYINFLKRVVCFYRYFDLFKSYLLGCSLGIIWCLCGVGQQFSLGHQDEMLSVLGKNYLNWWA